MFTSSVSGFLFLLLFCLFVVVVVVVVLFVCLFSDVGLRLIQFVELYMSSTFVTYAKLRGVGGVRNTAHTSTQQLDLSSNLVYEH